MFWGSLDWGEGIIVMVREEGRSFSIIRVFMVAGDMERGSRSCCWFWILAKSSIHSMQYLAVLADKVRQ